MRKSVIVAVTLVLCLLLQTTFVFAASWNIAASSNNQNCYFDTESVRYIKVNHEKHIEVWVHFVLHRPLSDGTKTYIQKLWYQTDTKMFSIKAEHLYDINGTHLRSNSYPNVWYDIIPGTMGETIYDNIKSYCERNR
ncbi:surface-adhesin E family protein [Dendrosporobacter sp. 1207_IL3150]|uniref:surface-adhesin E family protein n=1 Tax=Dendrosporobacter sp. 1207_IL3150 TaxID=3084054 RepID=UPI002FDB1F6A